MNLKRYTELQNAQNIYKQSRSICKRGIVNFMEHYLRKFDNGLSRKHQWKFLSHPQYLDWFVPQSSCFGSALRPRVSGENVHCNRKPSKTSLSRTGHI